jgi:hypothetical protein
VIESARKAGWVFRHTAGVDMLIDEAQPGPQSICGVLILFHRRRLKKPARVF